MKVNLQFTKIFYLRISQLYLLEIFSLHGFVDLAELKIACSLNNYWHNKQKKGL